MVTLPLEQEGKEEQYSEEESAAMRVYSKWSKLVVNICVKNDNDEIVAHGSGFLWDDKGHVVTNAHVLHIGQEYLISHVSKGKVAMVEARLLGADSLRDVAVLRMNGKPTKFNSYQGGVPRVGQRVHVLGSPFGLEQSLSVGVVSATGRELGIRRDRPPLFDLVQMDAAVNRGCSGGPMVSASGRLLGMTVAIATPTGAFAGVGFSVPYETVRNCAEVIIESDGKRVPPFATLGVVLASPRAVASLGVRDGLLVVRTRHGGPAQKAGLRGTETIAGSVVLGDFIVGIEDVHVKKVADVWRALRKHEVGDEITIRVRRLNEGPVSMNITLMDRQEIGEDAIHSAKVSPSPFAKL